MLAWFEWFYLVEWRDSSTDFIAPISKWQKAVYMVKRGAGMGVVALKCDSPPDNGGRMLMLRL